MVRSMTAYGAATHNQAGIASTVEIRTYNSRHLDIVLRIPRKYRALEEKIKGVIAGSVSRGRIEVNVQLDHDQGEFQHWELNPARADAYHRVLQSLQARYALAEGQTLALLAQADGVVRTVEPVLEIEALWAALQPALSAALENLLEMREREGAALAEDLQSRIGLVEDLAQRIAAQAEGMVAFYRERLTRRIEQLTQGTTLEVDPVRIAQEVAFQADRSDISEELVRCDSHIRQFRDIMSSAEPAGRKLNFLLQELNRELNTIGSKAERADIAHRVVDAKAELEKIREQVQNVE